jgi:hypothetical protein
VSLMGTLVKITDLDLLIITALGAGERSYLSRAVRRNDGSLVPVEDVAASLAPLPEGNDRAAFVDDLATSHLYRHLAELLARAGPLMVTVGLPPK